MQKRLRLMASMLAQTLRVHGTVRRLAGPEGIVSGSKWAVVSQDESSLWRALNIRLRSVDFFSEGDRELLGVTEKESHEEASVSGRRSPLLSTSAWL